MLGKKWAVETKDRQEIEKKKRKKEQNKSKLGRTTSRHEEMKKNNRCGLWYFSTCHGIGTASGLVPLKLQTVVLPTPVCCPNVKTY
jgi:hypothetical protein